LEVDIEMPKEIVDEGSAGHKEIPHNVMVLAVTN